jgi:hypothetical protein
MASSMAPIAAISPDRISIVYGIKLISYNIHKSIKSAKISNRSTKNKKYSFFSICTPIQKKKAYSHMDAKTNPIHILADISHIYLAKISPISISINATSS